MQIDNWSNLYSRLVSIRSGNSIHLREESKKSSDFLVSFLVFSIFLFTLIFTPQKSEALEKGNVNLSLWAGAKGSSNINVLPRGRKAKPAFNTLPDAGLRTYFPVSDNYEIFAVADFTYANYFYTTQDVNLGVDYTTSISALLFGTGLYFEGFELGLRYGVPIAAELVDLGTLDEGNLQNILSFTFGYSYTFYQSEGVGLAAFLKAEMLLNDVYKKYPSMDPLSGLIAPDQEIMLRNDNNPRLAAATVGFELQLDLMQLISSTPNINQPPDIDL
ncbi:MAG: hypothetical protein Kapaf2KO_14760 [Candidatus Kapaibacteriales bacterium]